MRNFPPNLAILIIVFILAGTAGVIYIKQQSKPVALKTSQETSPESSPSPTLAASAENSASDSTDADYIDPGIPQPSDSPLPSPVSSSNYIYPGSNVLSSSPSKIEMQSKDDATKITNWYKDKIRELNFNAKSFSQTSTNGVIFNKLSAAKPEEKIEITIKKDQNTSNVSITVDRP